MKELSIEEKARNYDEAIERAKAYQGLRPEMEFIFPELKNEDERIRKAIEYAIGQSTQEALAWLEKQGKLMKALQISNSRIAELVEEKYNLEEKLKKQGENNMGISETTKQELEDKLNKALKKETPESLNEFLDENPADKIGPKFKVGDWVVYENRVGLIIRMLKEHYIISFDGVEEQVSFKFNDRIAKWTIQDAKDGDVLVMQKTNVTYDSIFIFKKIENNRIIQHLHYFTTDAGEEVCEAWSIGGFLGFVGTTVYPATKEQRDILFQKMHEAGYTWDAEKKELKKEKEEVYNLHNYLYGKQDPVWSEEDKDYYDAIITKLEVTQEDATLTDNQMNFLKSLKDRVLPQPKQELNKENDDKLIEYINEERNKKGFLFNGEEASWNEIPLNVRKHDYPYYFKGELDCFPFTP